jgi:hypothetical protein
VDKPLPCPFCGQDPQWSVAVDHTTLFCSCGVQTDRVYNYSPESRVKTILQIWNRRTVSYVIQTG